MDLRIAELTLQLFCRALEELIYRPDEKDLTWVQEECLRYIHRHNEPLVKDVAGGLRISNAAATKLIDRLERKGLVKRFFPSADRRQVTLGITESGTKLIEKRQLEQRHKLENILQKMNPQKREELIQGLTCFLTAGLTDKEQIERICKKCGILHLPDCPGNLTYRALTGEDKKDV